MLVPDMRDVCDELPGACVCGSVGSQYTAGAPKTPDLSGRRLHAGVETQPLPSSAQGQVRRWAAARETEPQSRLRRGLHATKPGEAELYFVSHKQSGCKALEVGLSHTSHSSPIQGEKCRLSPKATGRLKQGVAGRPPGETILAACAEDSAGLGQGKGGWRLRGPDRRRRPFRAEETG